MTPTADIRDLPGGAEERTCGAAAEHEVAKSGEHQGDQGEHEHGRPSYRQRENDGRGPRAEERQANLRFPRQWLRCAP